MTATPRRAPSGAAVFQPEVTTAITAAALDELAEHGYGRLSMEGVAKRAGVGKSALYRRWPSKQDMVIAVVSELSVPLADVPDTGSLHSDVLAALRAVTEWLTHPLMSSILPDLVAESGRNPTLAEAMRTCIGEPRRTRVVGLVRRAIERGELAADTDAELVMDLLGALPYWRLAVRRVPLESGYLERAAEIIVRAISAP